MAEEARAVAKDRAALEQRRAALIADEERVNSAQRALDEGPTAS